MNIRDIYTMTSESNEAALSTAWRYLSDKTHITAVLTAFHASHDAHGNHARLLALAAIIRQLGYGFVFLEGHWLDRDASQAEQYEAGMAVSAYLSTAHAFINDIRKLANRYEQEAVLISNRTGARLMLKDGRVLI